MIITYYDGSTLTCSKIEFSGDGKNLIADDYRIVPLLEVLRIETYTEGGDAQ